MINGRRVLAVVLARGGSKGLPGKNLLPLGNRPMIAWSIDAARAARLVDRVIVSTDDPAIAEAAAKAGGEVPFLRPAEYAQDASTIHEPLFHALDHIDGQYDYIVGLQATSPLRTAADIDGGIQTCEDTGAPACISVTAAAKSIYWSFTIGADKRLAPVLRSAWQTRRRQELPPACLPNGALYIARVDWYRTNRTFVTDETVGYVMPPERSFDVDTSLDMTMIRAIVSEETSQMI